MKLYNLIKYHSDYDNSSSKVIAVCTEEVIAELQMLLDPDFVGNIKKNVKYNTWDKPWDGIYHYSWWIDQIEINRLFD